MTLVVAKMFGSRIVTMSDTMISDRNARAPNIVPGRLKSIVLNTWLTVSYSGLANQGLDAIRELAALLFSSTDAALAKLADCSKELGGEVDFIICSHEQSRSPRSIKVSSGRVFEGALTYWIGSPAAAAALSRYKARSAPPKDLPECVDANELDFTGRFHEYMKACADTTVGGATVNCLGSEFGHCYQDHASSSWWEPITVPDDEDPRERAAKHRTGIVSHEYHVYTACNRGVAVVGLYLGQPGIGYIYDPLISDEALLFRVHDQSAFRELLTSYERRRQTGWRPKL